MSLHIDGCSIGFTSKSQYNRFIRMRTYIGRDGHRHIIGRITKALGKFYTHGEEIDPKKARYNMAKEHMTAREKQAEEEKRLLEDAQFYASDDDYSE